MFSYRPGQFLTVRIPHDRWDGSVARCYSLSSSPDTGDRPTITVKRMAGGHASNWIADQVAAGERAGDPAPGRDVQPALRWTPTSCCSAELAGSPR